MNGYVYLARRDDGLIKIGHSEKPEERMVALKHTSRWSCTLIWKLACVDQVAAEKSLHMLFGRKHQGREFFDLSQSDVEWIMAQTEESIYAAYDPKSFARLDSGFWRL